MGKKMTRDVFVANDGEEFLTEEAMNFYENLTYLRETLDEYSAALSREDLLPPKEVVRAFNHNILFAYYVVTQELPFIDKKRMTYEQMLGSLKDRAPSQAD